MSEYKYATNYLATFKEHSRDAKAFDLPVIVGWKSSDPKVKPGDVIAYADLKVKVVRRVKAAENRQYCKTLGLYIIAEHTRWWEVRRIQTSQRGKAK